MYGLVIRLYAGGMMSSFPGYYSLVYAVVGVYGYVVRLNVSLWETENSLVSARLCWKVVIFSAALPGHNWIILLELHIDENSFRVSIVDLSAVKICTLSVKSIRSSSMWTDKFT